MMELLSTDKGTEGVLELVGAAHVDDVEGAFVTLYRQRYRDVYRYALLMLRRVEDAEDVTAEAFQRAYSAWQSGRGPTGDSLPWLLLITRRLVIDKVRRRRLLSWLPLGPSIRHSSLPTKRIRAGRNSGSGSNALRESCLNGSVRS